MNDLPDRTKSKAARRFAVLCCLVIGPSCAALAAQEPAAASAPPVSFPAGELVEDVACLNDPTQTYTLYLPSAYTAERRWPVLFIFDPRGRSVMAAEIFLQAAERYGWILMSSDNTRSDGPWDPNFKAVAAMWPDLERYAFDEQRIYAGGFSGGAMLAWIVGQKMRQLAGVIGSGGRPVEIGDADHDVPFAHFGAAGDEEFNYEPMREIDATAAKHGAPHRFEPFPGPHAWMPASLALEAVEWMELQAMREGTRQTDAELVEALFAKDLAKAVELERSAKPLLAQRRYDAIARTFDGLRDIGEVRRRAEDLANSRAIEQALEAERQALRYQRLQLTNMSRILQTFRDPAASATPADADRLANQLRLSSLQKTAAEETPKGLAARRVLNSLGSQVGFYFPRDFFQAGDYRRAAVVLEVATRLGNPNAGTLYNLACALARSGSRKKAVDALERAVAAGYSNLEHMEQDEDLKSLRKHDGYKAIVARLRAPSEEKKSSAAE